MVDYNTFKVPELKEFLKKRGIPSTGLSRKQQIVDALEKDDEERAETTQTLEGPAAGRKGDGEEEQEQVAEEAQTEETAGEVQPAPQTEEVAPQAEEPAKTVLEANEAIPKTPSLPTSPGTESQLSTETRKRKRRSPTPSVEREEMRKKLKAAEENAELPEVRVDEDATVKETEEGSEEKVDDEPEPMTADNVVEDAPVAVETTAESGGQDGEGETVLPLGVRDDVMEVDDAPAPLPASKAAVREDILATPPEQDAALALDGIDESTPSQRSQHPPTRSLYIRDLVRPLQPHQLRAHLISLASPHASTSDDSTLHTFHLDTLRTHAFATFSSPAAASRTRSSLHGQIWPPEPSRKALWVDFIPDEKVQEWIDKETDAGASKRDAKRWEVVYDTTDLDAVIANHVEATAVSAQGSGIPPRQPSFASPTLANAPLGPRADRVPPPPKVAPSPSPVPAQAQIKSSSFLVLDERFSSTSAKPKLYYLPVSSELAEKRMDEIRDKTSRDWQEGSGDSGGGVEAQLRRYTFEDGDRLVDGGPDFGSFGRPGSGGGGGGGGRGRGGRYRGR